MSRSAYCCLGFFVLFVLCCGGFAAAKDIYLGKNIVFGPQEVTVEQCQQGPIMLDLPKLEPSEDYMLQIKGDPRRTDVIAKVTVNDCLITKYVPTYIDHQGGTASLLVSAQEDNRISVLVAGDPSTSVSLTLFDHGRKLSNIHREDGLWVDIRPDILMVGETQEIEFSISVTPDNTAFHITTVDLEEVDSDGKQIEPVGELHDRGGGVFLLKKTIAAGNKPVIRYFAFILNRGEATEYTRIVSFDIHQPRSQADDEAEKDIQQRAAQEYRRLKEMVSQKDALAQVMRMIADDPHIISVGYNVSGLWGEFSSHVLWGLPISERGVRGGKARGGLRQTNPDDSSLFPESTTR